MDNHENPVMGVGELMKEMESLEQPQQLFILDRISLHFKYAEYDEVDLTEALTLLKSHIISMQPIKPKVANLRETLKTFVMDELEALPETVKELEPLQRLNIVTKLIPFVMPRVDSVHFEKGEPDGWSL